MSPCSTRRSIGLCTSHKCLFTSPLRLIACSHNWQMRVHSSAAPQEAARLWSWMEIESPDWPTIRREKYAWRAVTYDIERQNDSRSTVFQIITRQSNLRYESLQFQILISRIGRFILDAGSGSGHYSQRSRPETGLERFLRSGRVGCRPNSRLSPTDCQLWLSFVFNAVRVSRTCHWKSTRTLGDNGQNYECKIYRGARLSPNYLTWIANVVWLPIENQWS